jgi:hypothetical protein
VIFGKDCFRIDFVEGERVQSDGRNTSLLPPTSFHPIVFPKDDAQNSRKVMNVLASVKIKWQNVWWNCGF